MLGIGIAEVWATATLDVGLLKLEESFPIWKSSRDQFVQLYQ
jgi:hypothetical protein